jgi:hypothetical protein
MQQEFNVADYLGSLCVRPKSQLFMTRSVRQNRQSVIKIIMYMLLPTLFYTYEYPSGTSSTNEFWHKLLALLPIIPPNEVIQIQVI